MFLGEANIFHIRELFSYHSSYPTSLTVQKKDLNAAANRSSCVSYTCLQAFIDLAKLLQSDWPLSERTD